MGFIIWLRRRIGLRSSDQCISTVVFMIFLVCILNLSHMVHGPLEATSSTVVKPYDLTKASRRILRSESVSSKRPKDLDTSTFIHPLGKYHAGEPKYPVTLNAPYLLNNQTVCSEISNLTLLILVHTAPTHFDRRLAFRRTWTNSSYFSDLGTVKVLFLLGTPNSSVTQDMIEEEFAEYGDILQGNFKDTYRNLTHKAVMGYKWVSKYCTHAQMLLKVDDDVAVNTYALLSKHVHLMNLNRSIACFVVPKKYRIVVRDKKSKWYVNEEEFKGFEFYPKFCSGYFVLVSTDLVHEMYEAAYRTPFFWIDDVYMYGLVTSRFGNITYHHLHPKYTTGANKRQQYSDICMSRDLFVITTETCFMDHIWSIFTRQHMLTRIKALIWDVLSWSLSVYC